MFNKGRVGICGETHAGLGPKASQIVEIVWKIAQIVERQYKKIVQIIKQIY